MKPIEFQSRSVDRASTVFETLLVVAVIAGLMGTIGVCVASYQQGAGRTECIKQITSVQRTVRAHQQQHDLKPGHADPRELLVGPGRLFATPPCCPVSGEAYEWENRLPVEGRAVVRCPHAAERGHSPSGTAGW